MARLTKIYTRTGDDGKTQFGKTRILKNDLRIDAIGHVDELNSALGVVLATELPDEVQVVLTQVQNDLFDLGGELWLPELPVIDHTRIDRLEKTIDHWNQDLPILEEFILPGGNISSAHCQLARSICRRAERSMVALDLQEKLRKELLSYINRLSDLLFVAARVIMKTAHCQEVYWRH